MANIEKKENIVFGDAVKTAEVKPAEAKTAVKKTTKTAAKKAEAKNENKKAPKTGDESMPIAYMLTLVGAAVAAIIVLIKRKRTI